MRVRGHAERADTHAQGVCELRTTTTMSNATSGGAAAHTAEDEVGVPYALDTRHHAKSGALRLLTSHETIMRHDSIET